MEEKISKKKLNTILEEMGAQGVGRRDIPSKDGSHELRVISNEGMVDFYIYVKGSSSSKPLLTLLKNEFKGTDNFEIRSKGDVSDSLLKVFLNNAGYTKTLATLGMQSPTQQEMDKYAEYISVQQDEIGAKKATR